MLTSFFDSSAAATAAAAKAPAPKVVFGVVLGVVAQYGFVTSMIAGQRHDLPGVCFSTVEEIYRRGQGALSPPSLLDVDVVLTRATQVRKSRVFLTSLESRVGSQSSWTFTIVLLTTESDTTSRSSPSTTSRLCTLLWFPTRKEVAY